MRACLHKISGHLVRTHDKSGGDLTVGMVLATAVGGSAQHSQCLWGTFAHLPG